MKETTRIITIEITDIIKGDTSRDAEAEKRGLETLFSNHDDLHIRIQDFEMEIDDGR